MNGNLLDQNLILFNNKGYSLKVKRAGGRFFNAFCVRVRNEIILDYALASVAIKILFLRVGDSLQN